MINVDAKQRQVPSYRSSARDQIFLFASSVSCDFSRQRFFGIAASSGWQGIPICAADNEIPGHFAPVPVVLESLRLGDR